MIKDVNLIKRQKCVINDTELEILSKENFPLFCGCIESDLREDLICEQEWVISKEGVIQLKNLIPLEILYASGHDAEAMGTTGFIIKIISRVF